MYWIIGIGCLFVGTIWLQFIICKKGRKRAGIILPVLMLIITAAVALIISTSEVTTFEGLGQDSNGNLVATATSSCKILSNSGKVLKVIVIGSICTITLGGVYVVFNKKKSSAARELKKMNVQDL